jgi:uncharacterized protein YggE
MNHGIFLLIAASMAGTGALQVAGGSAAFRQDQGSRFEAARRNELAKRQLWKQEDGRYLEAAILANVPADEYLATFSISAEGKTLAEARSRLQSQIDLFRKAMGSLQGIDKASHVDFVSQNRVYGFQDAGGNVVREVLEGFEIKSNVILRYRSSKVLDSILSSAASAEVFDLVKVDYIVKDSAKIQALLIDEASKVIKRRANEIQKLFGLEPLRLNQVLPPQFSVYYPNDLYDSYVAQESEAMIGYRPNQAVQTARKPRSFYYRGLDARDFDVVLGNAHLEPMVQFTVYVRVKY